jgi:signal transduction histidine kinase
MVYVLKQSNEEMFLNSTRGHARFLADSLERIADPNSNKEIVEILDSVVLSGSGLYSQLTGTEHKHISSLVDKTDIASYQEDFEIGEHDDNVYFISVPVLMGTSALNLQVGFDETPFLEQNAKAYKNGLIVISIYLVLLLLLLPVIGRRVVRPVKDLQRTSREIASGALTKQLTVESDLVEFVDLAEDLDRMKNQLIGINQQLEREIEEREEAETQRRNLEHQLRHSQRLETVGTMAGGIAHELNNILVPIILYADIAIEDLSENSPIRGDMQRVLKSAKRAKGIVRQVLTFSRKMANNEHIQIDMAEAIRESVDFLLASMPPSISLEVSLTENCPPVMGDPALMQQLILNLCTNAMQSLPERVGSVRISLDVTEAGESLVESHPGLAGRKLVTLTIADNGHGMDGPTQNRIFEPFFTTRPVGDGTGLGLSVVHGIVTDLDGVIEVESAPGSGATFFVFLPALEPEGAKA